MNEFAAKLFLRDVGSGRLDLADPEVRALLREIHGDRGDGLRRRSFPTLRTRAAATLAGRIEGTAATYGHTYGIGGGVRERILRGAFDASIEARPLIPLFAQHDWTIPIGLASVASAAHGVIFAADLFDTERARPVYEATKSGALDQVSVGFYPKVIDSKSERGVDQVVEGDLAELSVVVRGAAGFGARIEKVA